MLTIVPFSTETTDRVIFAHLLGLELSEFGLHFSVNIFTGVPIFTDLIVRVFVAYSVFLPE